MTVVISSTRINVYRAAGVVLVMLVGLASARESRAAYAVTYLSDVGPPFFVPGIEPDTTGATMAGARVEVFYNSGPAALLPSETVWLAKTGPVKGTAEGGLGYGVSGGPLWTFELDGNPESDDWVLRGFLGDTGADPVAAQWGINKIVIDLPPGAAVWDKSAPIDTPNSGMGITFNSGSGTLSSPPNIGLWDVDVQYVNPVALEGSAGPLGDVFTTLEINFSSPFDVGDRLVFLSDSDLIVPEPSTLCCLVGLGLLGMLGLYRPRRRDTPYVPH